MTDAEEHLHIKRCKLIKIKHYRLVWSAIWDTFVIQFILLSINILGYDKYMKGYDQYINDYDKYMKGYYKYITGYDNYIDAYDKYTKDFL